MTTKNLIVLGVAAVAVGAAAYLTGGGRTKAPALAGKKIVQEFKIQDVASVEIGDKVRLAATDAGWTVASMQDYPADAKKIADSLMSLQDLKVGQVARGRDLGKKTVVAVKDAAGKTLASVTLGDRHEKWGHGRYADMNGTTVLVADSLDAFGDDEKRWCSTKIIDTPYVSFKELADPSLDEATLGFATGVVKTVTIGDNTNRVATVGNVVAGGTDRYVKLDGEKWVFVVSKYAADALLPKPEPKEEKKDEAKTDAEAKSATTEKPKAKAEDSKSEATPHPKAIIETEPIELPPPAETPPPAAE